MNLMPESKSPVTQRGSTRRPLRVLQLVAMLFNGGPERWLVDLCYLGPAQGLSMDLAVIWDIKGIFATKAQELGIPVYRCPAGSPVKFIANLRKLLRKHGPYDAIHCHLHAFSCFAMIAAKLEGVPIRVAHSHNVVGNVSGSLGRRAYITMARALLGRFATAGLAPSAASLEDLFGPRWRLDKRWRVMPCGIDLEPFRGPLPLSSFREDFGIPRDALLLGSVGRLVPEKNSEFLVDVLAEALRLRADTYMVLIGEGPLRERLLQKAAESCFSDRLILPGTRDDVAALMRSVIDVFVFPSPPPPRGNEALPIAVVEAQAAGLQIVVSDGIPAEAVLAPELVVQIKADTSPAEWAEVVIQQSRRRSRYSPGFDTVSEKAFDVISKSDHNCVVSLRHLAAIYRGRSDTTER